MRSKGEGTFFYSRTEDRWIGRIGEITVKSKDKKRAREKWLAAREKHAQGGNSSFVPTVGELWADLVEEKRKRGRSTTTIRWYEDLASAHLSPIASLRADDVTVQTVELWLEDRTYLNTSTLSRLRNSLTQSFNIALRRRQITWNPASLAQVPQGQPSMPGEILTWDEVDRLLDAAKGHRLETWLHLMLNTGLRPHEAYELTWEDVDLEKLTVTARPRKAKAKVPRVVEIKLSTRNLLAAHKTRMAEERLLMGSRWPSDHDPLVFRSQAGTPLDGKNMNRLLKRWLDKAGIEKHIHVYDLRRTAASLAADAGVPVVTLADYMGNDPATLEKHYRKPVSPVRRLDIDIATRAADETAVGEH
ncbi:MAG: site-specific integrase [Acidobacteria bacterium]|nr:site-specific integrase [Acidobacteriota bacterium]